MKALLIAGNILFLSILLLQKCTVKPVSSTNAMMTQQNCVPCKDYSGVPLDLMDAQVAKDIAARYANDDGKRYVTTSTGTIMEDARSAWFSLETLKNFIYKLEDPLCRSGCPDMNLGIRFYYAKYPDYSLDTVKSGFAHLHTIFMVATYNNGRENVDFDPANRGSDPCRPKTFAQWFAEGINLMQNPSLVLSVQNHGDLAPPPPGAALFGN